MAKKKAKKRTGRKPKLTAKRKETILRAVRLGLTYDRAAQLANIDQSTFYRWKKLGAERSTGVYYEFYKALKKAEVEGEVSAINAIAKAAKTGTWQAAAWLLERRHPTRWARVQKFELSWKDQIKELVQSGTVSVDDVREELGDELATELFKSSGIQITSS